MSALVGDFMPPHDSPMTGSPSPNAPVHVLRGRHQPTENIDRRANAYVGTTTTDAEGRFQIALPPGIYTVVSEVDGRPYLNSYDGTDGTWAAITVVAGEWTLIEIQDSSRATF